MHWLFSFKWGNKADEDIGREPSRPAPPPIHHGVPTSSYTDGVFCEKDLIYVTETKGQERRTTQLPTPLQSMELEKSLLEQYLAEYISAHMLGWRIGWWVGGKVSHEPQNPVSTPALHLPLSQGGSLSWAFRSPPALRRSTSGFALG